MTRNALVVFNMFYQLMCVFSVLSLWPKQKSGIDMGISRETFGCFCIFMAVAGVLMLAYCVKAFLEMNSISIMQILSWPFGG